jgi:hypothetical protein
MLYALYNDDGSIHQANKVYDCNDYDKLLLDRGLKFVSANLPGPVSPDHWLVDTTANALCERPVMPITVNKTLVKAGANDSALFQNIPRKANCSISTMSAVVYGGVLDSDELEIAIPVPCIYRVAFELWPYKRFEVDIEAAA